MNTLYFGDNLEILRDRIPSESIDLIYLDPPFNSGATYNMIFQPESDEVTGQTSQRRMFKDTWTWATGEAKREYDGLIEGTLTKERPSQKLIDLMKAMYSYLGGCSMMAYLAMMAPRLWEMRRVLKPTGSIYLHCDPTASHYLKMLMDAVLGTENFCNEIVWHYRKWPAGKYAFQSNHDIILFYSRTGSRGRTFNQLYMKRAPSTLKRFGNATIVSGHDEQGKRVPSQTTTEESVGVRQDDVWEIGRVPPIKQLFPTQKPEALLRRAITASSNESDVVLDPFCGCGTAVVVAERLHRQWIGIDIAYYAIDVIKKRFAKDGLKEGTNFAVEGEPADEYSAGKLAEKSPFNFQDWCVSKIPGANPADKKTGDRGADGFVNFVDPINKSGHNAGVISVKGEKTVNPEMVRELIGTVNARNAPFGILITLRESTPGMRETALAAGNYDFRYREENAPMRIPKIQLLSVKDLFSKFLPIKLPPTLMEPIKLPPVRKPEQRKLASEEKGVL